MKALLQLIMITCIVTALAGVGALLSKPVCGNDAYWWTHYPGVCQAERTESLWEGSLMLLISVSVFFIAHLIYKTKK